MKFINSFRELFIYFPSRVISPLHYPMFHSPLFALELPTLQSVCNDENQKYRFSIFSAAPSRIFVVFDERMGECEIGKNFAKNKDNFSSSENLLLSVYLVTHRVLTSYFPREKTSD